MMQQQAEAPQRQQQQQQEADADGDDAGMDEGLKRLILQNTHIQLCKLQAGLLSWRNSAS